MSRQEVNSQAPSLTTENTQNSIKTLQDLANEYNIDINQFNDTFIWYFNMMLKKYHKNGFDYEFGRYFRSEYVISYQDVLFQMKYDLMYWYGSDSLYVSIYNSTSPKLIRAYEDFDSKAFALYDSDRVLSPEGCSVTQRAFDEALVKLKQAIHDVKPNDFVRLLFCLLDMKDYENERWGQWSLFWTDDSSDYDDIQDYPWRYDSTDDEYSYSEPPDLIDPRAFESEESDSYGYHPEETKITDPIIIKVSISSESESESFRQPLVELKYPEESNVDTAVVPMEASIKDQPYYRIEYLALKLDVDDESAVEIIVKNKGEKCKESAEIVYKQILEKLEKLGYDGDYTFKDALDFAKKILEGK